MQIKLFNILEMTRDKGQNFVAQVNSINFGAGESSFSAILEAVGRERANEILDDPNTQTEYKFNLELGCEVSSILDEDGEPAIVIYKF